LLSQSLNQKPPSGGFFFACRITQRENPMRKYSNDRYDAGMSFSEINHTQALSLYRTMQRIRAFENAAEEASQGGVSAYGKAATGMAAVRGPLHLSTGQEAVAAGVCAHLRADDYLTSTHRGHGHTLAKGASLEKMMHELFGKATGFNGGKGGSMHIADFSVGMLGANGVVAAGLPIAVGAAHAQKLQQAPGMPKAGGDAITVCFFGDGAINRGPFLEALNWARVFNLNILFVCEDNRWSATTATEPMTAGRGAAERAESLGIVGERVDGNDAVEVYEAAGQLIHHMREKRLTSPGPRLLHAITYRVKGHVSVDPAKYRDAAEHAKMLENDCLVRLEAFILEEFKQIVGMESALSAIKNEALAEVQAAVDSARAAPLPQASSAYTDIQSVGQGQWR
jgi:acetoin:2,6-dichlorophenolindophenol oxidoreductase subunit alpha